MLAEVEKAVERIARGDRAGVQETLRKHVDSLQNEISRCTEELSARA